MSNISRPFRVLVWIHALSFVNDPTKIEIPASFREVAACEHKYQAEWIAQALAESKRFQITKVVEKVGDKEEERGTYYYPDQETAEAHKNDIL